MNKFDTAMPYIASYVIVRKGKKIAFVLRSNTSWMNGYYTLPSGKVETGESYTAAAIREVEEEIGINVVIENMHFVHAVHRHEETDWVDMYFEAKKWTGKPFNAEPHMHEELTWIDPSDLPDKVVPCVRDALKQIQTGKSYSEYGWV